MTASTKQSSRAERIGYDFYCMIDNAARAEQYCPLERWHRGGWDFFAATLRVTRHRFPVSQFRPEFSDKLSTDELEITSESISRWSFYINSRQCGVLHVNVTARSVRAIKHLGVTDSRSCLSTILNLRVSRPSLRAINRYCIIHRYLFLLGCTFLRENVSSDFQEIPMR